MSNNEAILANYFNILPVSPSIIAIVFLSSCIHAGWNYLAKTIPSGVPFVWLMAVCTTVCYAPIITIYLFLYGFEANFWNIVFLTGTAIIHLVYFLVLQYGYRASDLSVVYPLARGTGPLFATLGAVWFFQEKISLLSVGGLVLVVAGVLLVAGLTGRFPKDKRVQKGILYGVVTGLLIATYTLWDSYAVRTLLIAPILIEYFSHPLRVIVLAPLARQNWGETRRLWISYRVKILIISAISPISFLLVLYALQRAPVHYVAPARELSIVIGVILGAKLLNEEHFKSRLIGSLLIVAGIALLSFGG